MWRFCAQDVGGVWNVNNEGVKLLSWSPSEANGPWNISPTKKYCKELLRKFKIDKSKDATTHMAINFNLSADEKGNFVDQENYIGIIGSLLYLTSSRLNIMCSVCVCACY